MPACRNLRLPMHAEAATRIVSVKSQSLVMFFYALAKSLSSMLERIRVNLLSVYTRESIWH